MEQCLGTYFYDVNNDKHTESWYWMKGGCVRGKYRSMEMNIWSQRNGDVRNSFGVFSWMLNWTFLCNESMSTRCTCFCMLWSKWTTCFEPSCSIFLCPREWSFKKGGCIRMYQLQATDTRNLSRWWSYWSDLGDWTHPTPEGERCTTTRSQLSMSIHTFIAPSVSKYFGHSFVRFVKMMNLVLFGAFVRRLNA